MTAAARILIVEDDEAMRVSCRQALEGVGHRVLEAGSAREAEPILLRDEIDLVVTDLRMPHGGGEQVLRIVKHVAPEVPVLIITAYPSVESAVESFKSGVADYLLKPFTGEQLVESIEHALRASHAGDRAAILRNMGARDREMPEMTGGSAAFREMLAGVRRVAPHDGNVLISGETGSGKELVARAVHRFSRCAAGPFTVVNCAAIPENLIEAELFGYDKGAFTGASTSKPGLFEAAGGGSLFLDEVAELSAVAQAKLLRAIEEKAVRRVGAIAARSVDARIITATHRDLRVEVSDGRFREDLLYRLAVLELRVPPLRERLEDVPALAIRFLDHAQRNGARRVVGFTDAALERLVEHAWPGNVRELQNVVQKAIARAEGPVILAEDLVLAAPPRDRAGAPAADPGGRRVAIAEFESAYVQEVLRREGGNVTHTARALGVHRTTLQRMLKKLAIDAEEYRSD